MVALFACKWIPLKSHNGCDNMLDKSSFIMSSKAWGSCSKSFFSFRVQRNIQKWMRPERTTRAKGIMAKTFAAKVLLIGWDAADWDVINPLMDRGEMPNLESLVNTGVMGNLSTLYPELSPMLWTSIATGKRAFKHGIHGFTEPDPLGNGVRPVTNLSRKTKALWNILCQNGKKCNVVGWWPSHPGRAHKRRHGLQPLPTRQYVRGQTLAHDARNRASQTAHQKSCGAALASAETRRRAISCPLCPMPPWWTRIRIIGLKPLPK